MDMFCSNLLIVESWTKVLLAIPSSEEKKNPKGHVIHVMELAYIVARHLSESFLTRPKVKLFDEEEVAWKMLRMMSFCLSIFGANEKHGLALNET